MTGNLKKTTKFRKIRGLTYLTDNSETQKTRIRANRSDNPGGNHPSGSPAPASVWRHFCQLFIKPMSDMQVLYHLVTGVCEARFTKENH